MCALNTELAYLQYAWRGKGGKMWKIVQLNFLYFVVRLLNNNIIYIHTITMQLRKEKTRV